MGKEPVFVFGSNTAGIHGAGAARHAYERHGAISGRGIGLWGNSYAIPTKGHTEHKGWNGRIIRNIGGPLSLADIKKHVEAFKNHARMHFDRDYKVTQIGCGLAGFKPEDIAPMFVGSPSNCLFDGAWHPWLGDSVRYWGTL